MNKTFVNNVIGLYNGENTITLRMLGDTIHMTCYVDGVIKSQRWLTVNAFIGALHYKQTNAWFTSYKRSNPIMYCLRSEYLEGRTMPFMYLSEDDRQEIIEMILGYHMMSLEDVLGEKLVSVKFDEMHEHVKVYKNYAPEEIL